MDSEVITALDDVDQDLNARLNSTAPFSPPSLSVSQYKQLELLQHLSLYSELVILFSGEKGMGKTFIAQALIASREDPDQSLMIDADFLSTYLDILQQIAQHIDLAELDNVEALESQVIGRCQQLLDDEQGSFLLIVDDADQLSNEVLLNLNQLALIQPNALHVMFLATPALEEVLSELPEPHAPLHIMQVDCLTESESEIVLLEQFPDQDWSGEQVDYMLKQAKGSPGKLMYIAQQLAAGSGDQDEQKEKSKFPITHIAAMLLVASVLIVSFLYKNSQTTAIEAPQTSQIEAVSVTSVATVDPEMQIKEEVAAIKDASEEEIDFNFIEPVSVSSNSSIEGNVDGAITQSDQTSIDSPVVKSPKIKDSTITNKKVTDDTVSATKTDRAGKSISFSIDEERLLSAKSTTFATQLFASYSEKSAQTFIQDNKTKVGALLYYRTEYKGKPWFVVVSGPFESKDIARAEVAKLPASLRKQKPWVRSIEPIQASLVVRAK
jgi:DamX protein